MTATVSWRLVFDPVDERDVVYALSCSTHPGGPVSADIISGAAAIADVLSPSGMDPVTTWSQQWRGPLAEPAAEREFAIEMGSMLVPDVLRNTLLNATAGERHLVTVSARGWLALVPWDLAALDDRGDVRLCERATVVSAIAPTAQVGRFRRASPASIGPPLLVVDPGPRRGGHDRLGPLYTGRLPPAWRAEVSIPSDGRAKVHPTDTQPVTSARLSELLTGGSYHQFTYFGHVVGGTENAPAAARLVLSDDDDVHTRLTAHSWLMTPDRWPMPRHVALIGCGSDDAAPHERSGLPMAAINAGARIVTATRWTLPNDDPATAARGYGATTMLATAVTRAHATARPLEQLRSWQLGQLERWRHDGSREVSPLLWGSLVTYLAAD